MQIGFRYFFMHPVVLFFLCSSFTVTAQRRLYNISRGSSLKPTGNSSWLSRSGLYAFGFYQQAKGYAVGVFIAGIPEKTVVWTANRDNPPVSSNATLMLNAEGRLVLQSTQGPDTDIADVSPTALYASMLDSGNFVLYNSDGKIIWQSFEHPTDTVLPTQRLLAGMELLSSVSESDHSTGIFRLKMQNDGNLVQYPRDAPDTVDYYYWASLTYGMGDNVTLNLAVDASIYLLNSTASNIATLTEGGYATEGAIYMVRLDSDGIFRLYSHNLTQTSAWSVVWSSSTNKCDPLGLCGLNSFCVLYDMNPDCRCLPGFLPVNQGNWTTGCIRNSTTESCNNRSGSAVKNSIQPLESTLWEDVSYFVLSQTTKEECEQACLADCNCEAALFKDFQCRMQRLPLRFGRRVPRSNSNDIALIKVHKSALSRPDRIVPGVVKKEIRKDIIIIITCAFLAFLFVILAIFGYVMYRYHVKSTRRISGSVGFCEDIAPLSFTYAELERMTDGFKEEVGRGSSSTVYKGTMMDGKSVAVKRLQKLFSEAETEFETEIKVIGRTHHRNLVRLLGYSCDGPKILVYEYMNGSLADTLFNPVKQPNWVERIGIASDIARGILYLHDECESQIIHCDIKPQNVLMDENNCAKISDFGLAKLMKPNQTKTYTGIRGTRGYVAPEWHGKLPVTVKADVYSFGVVLLEIICSRKNVDQSLPEDQAILEDWVYQCFEAGELGQLVGDEEVEIKELERMIKVGLWCILDEPSLRPSMKKVLLMLEGTVDIPIPPRPTSFLSCI